MSGTFLIVGAAPRADSAGFYARLLARSGTVIAADAGGEWCGRLGRVPDVVVGDFDSAAPGAAERLADLGARVMRLSARKDVSDLDACVGEARVRRATEVTFCAAFDARLDHTLAAFGSVLRAADMAARIEEPGWCAWALSSEAAPELTLELSPGAAFSLIAPGGADGVTVNGGEYALTESRLEPLSSLGLSNVATAGGVSISLRGGALLVIVPEGT